MPFVIPSEDFHGGFGIPEDEVCVINYDDTDGDLTDEEYEAIAEEANDNVVRALIEAGGEINEARKLLNEAKGALLYMLILHKAQDPRCNQEKVVPALYMLQSEPDKWTPERADGVFKKIFDYLEQEEDDGT